MATYIKTIKDRVGNIIAPRTKTKAISTEDGRIIDNIMLIADTTVTEEPITPIPIGNAEDINYDNTISGLTSTNVQDAINEISQGTSSKTWAFIKGTYTWDLLKG